MVRRYGRLVHVWKPGVKLGRRVREHIHDVMARPAPPTSKHDDLRVQLHFAPQGCGAVWLWQLVRWSAGAE
eukprot:1622305-Pyramimonas_sp.AAC.2